MIQKRISKYLNELYPNDLASSFDNGKVGLQLGSETKEIKRILIALDATNNVIEEAISKKCDLLVVHHPFIFNPILSIDYDSIVGKKIVKVLSNNLNVYSMHTNFDVAIGGMNDILANKIGLRNIHGQDAVPSKDNLLRMGDIEPISLDKFTYKVCGLLNEEGAKYVGKPDKIISKVAIVGGAGSSEILNSRLLGCDCLITGEIHHHQALDVLENDFSVIEVSHFVEANFKQTVSRVLSNQFPDVEVLISEVEVNPFKFIKVK